MPPHQPPQVLLNTQYAGGAPSFAHLHTPLPPPLQGEIVMKNQLKKLLYNKVPVDKPETIAEWRLSPWKVFFLLLSIVISLTILYAYVFTDNPKEFLGNVVFYLTIIICAVAVLWLIGSTAIKGRKLISGFFISFILIVTAYWVLGAIFSYFNIMEFHMSGYAVWILMTILAGMGAKRIDGNLDRNDVGFALLVFIILLGANIPLNQHGGFLANVDHFVEIAKGWISGQISNVPTFAGVNTK